jgi:hypothetical protein
MSILEISTPVKFNGHIIKQLFNTYDKTAITILLLTI